MNRKKSQLKFIFYVYSQSQAYYTHSFVKSTCICLTDVHIICTMCFLISSQPTQITLVSTKVTVLIQPPTTHLEKNVAHSENVIYSIFLCATVRLFPVKNNIRNQKQKVPSYSLSQINIQFLLSTKNAYHQNTHTVYLPKLVSREKASLLIPYILRPSVKLRIPIFALLNKTIKKQLHRIIYKMKIFQLELHKYWQKFNKNVCHNPKFAPAYHYGL